MFQVWVLLTNNLHFSIMVEMFLVVKMLWEWDDIKQNVSGNLN